MLFRSENASLDFDGWATLGNVTLPEDLPEELREELEGHFSDNYLGELFSDQSQRDWEDKFCGFDSYKHIQETFDSHIKLSSHYSQTHCEVADRLVDSIRESARHVLDGIKELKDLTPPDSMLALFYDVPEDKEELKDQFLDQLDQIISDASDLYVFMADANMAADILTYLDDVYSYENGCTNATYLLQSEVDNWLEENLHPKEVEDPRQLTLSLDVCFTK